MAHVSANHSDDRDEIEAQSAEILSLLAQLTKRFASEEEEQWRWIAAHSPNPQIVELMRDSTITAMRVLDAVGRMEPVNGISVALRYHIPKGTVSKVTRRLIAQKLLSASSLPSNRKEIYFHLTPLGREFVDFHRSFDGQMEQGFRRFLQRYEPGVLRLLVQILRDANAASFLTFEQHEPINQASEQEGAPPSASAKEASE